MNRAFWFKVHSWVGFKLSLLLTFTLVTGTLAVVAHDLDWLSNPAKRVSPNSVTQLNWAKTYQSASDILPHSQFLILDAPIHSWYSIELTHFIADKQRHKQFFHPTTGAHLGDGRWYNWQRFFRMSHRHLMLPTRLGISIVGLMAILLFILLLTSVVVYRQWWKGFLRLPRTANRRVFWADTHRFIGVWSLWFMLIISVTGIWYLAELWGLKADYPTKVKATSELDQQAPSMPTLKLFESMLAEVNRIYPALKIRRIIFPTRAGDSVIFQGQANAILVRDRVNSVSFDPVSGEHLQTHIGEAQSTHVRISEAADPLHFGTFAGIASKLVYFIFGVLLSALSLSGTYMYGMRAARISRSTERPVNKAWRAASDKMHWGKWLSSAGIIACLVMTVVLFSGSIS